MSTRPTPYGLFAGVGLGTFGATTNLKLSDAAAPRRARPDMAWLLSLIGTLEARPALLRQLNVRTHPALFAAAGRVRLGDPTPLADSPQTGPVSVRASDALMAVLLLANSCIPYTRLVEELSGLIGATTERTDTFLTELWRQGLLLSNLRPPLTSTSPATHLVERLLCIADPPPEAPRLKAALDALSNWNRLNIAEAASEWPAVESMLESLQLTPDPAIQVDLGLSLVSASMSGRVAAEATRAAELLLRLTPLPGGSPHLAAYRAAFEARYGNDHEVPILELLDPELGLGPPARYGHGGGVDNRRLAVRQETLQTIALDAVAERRLTVQLDDATLARLALWEPSREVLPLSLDLCVFVLAASAHSVDTGDFRLAIGPNLGARQAGRYLARFADLLGRPAEEALAEIARAEALHAPNATWAELVYLPRRLRSANVTVRPAVREYEIAVGVPPGVPSDRAIPLNEVAVGVCDSRFRLRWVSRGTDIMLRSGHMLNSLQAPDVCRFLHDLAEDTVAQLSGFDWGPAAGFPFLPRIEAGRVVLSPARWRISASLRDAELGTDRVRFRERLTRFRERRMLPRYIYLTTGDNRLLLDLDAPAQADELRAELAGLGDTGALLLHEALPGPEHAWLQGPGGSYFAELVVPLVLRPGASRPSAQDAPATRGSAPVATGSSGFLRTRPPGSDWLFVKLYCPLQLEEELLVGPVREFCDRASRDRMVDGWFFIRYSDPEPHIRLRFRGDPNSLVSRLVPELCSWGGDLMAEGLSQRFALDTYDREVERYGGPGGMAAAEALFTVDSPAVVDLLALLRQNPDLDRLTLAIVSVDDLLASLGLGKGERLNWYRSHSPSRRISGADFRERKTALRLVLGSPNDPYMLPSGAEITRTLASRRQALVSVLGRLANLEKRGELSKPRASILQSIVHMHCNRLVGTDRSMEERVLGLLFRAHESLERAPLVNPR
jgi:thiopeptide-type bacteriocin biosynthesis protein